MIVVNTVEIFSSDNAVHISLSNGKKYKILLKDYENLPFECKSDSLLENIFIDVKKIELSETNKYFNDFDGDCVEFLAFLSRKYTIYRSAIAKVALTDIPKKMLIQKLYFSYGQYLKKANQNKSADNKIELEPETLKTLCGLVCDEFEASGYIDDKRYALDKAKYLKEYKKYGNGKIKEYLYQKRIPADIINGILDDEFFSDEEENFENMRNLLKKKYGENLNRLDKSDRNDIQKAINMLIRNGYKYQDAKNAVADFIDNTEIDIDYIENEEIEDY
ncbi:MAG: RecX family transcriptional regulator [Oscillospiraceae bacterium]|nr:RecX family transcriptional regulator [Oscillospiraceae bacterium]